jgi:5-methylcytosine-specific restriction endonuclease McrA
MPWFKVDDGFYDHPKVTALRKTAAGRQALGLWLCAGAYSSRHLLDGRVPHACVRLFGFTPKTAKELVTAGLWHEEGDSYFFIDWADYNPTKAQIRANREYKRANTSESRDGFKLKLIEKCGGSCHYCGEKLTERTGTVDHVVPRRKGGGTSLKNCVIACVSCNSRKGDRRYESGYACSCVAGYAQATHARASVPPDPARPDPTQHELEIPADLSASQAAHALAPADQGSPEQASPGPDPDAAWEALATAYAEGTGRKRDLPTCRLNWSGVHRADLRALAAKCDGPEDLKVQIRVLLGDRPDFMRRQGLQHWLRCLGVPTDGVTYPSANSGPPGASSRRMSGPPPGAAGSWAPRPRSAEAEEVALPQHGPQRPWPVAGGRMGRLLEQAAELARKAKDAEPQAGDAKP